MANYRKANSFKTNVMNGISPIYAFGTGWGCVSTWHVRICTTHSIHT